MFTSKPDILAALSVVAPLDNVIVLSTKVEFVELTVSIVPVTVKFPVTAKSLVLKF